MYELDQSDRHGGMPTGADMVRRDGVRQVRLRELLAAGTVMTGEDYYHSAMIFQHGQSPDDYLLAHILAVIAVGKGKREALWLAAATLDRYLRSSGKPQIFGTQFSGQSNKPGIQQDPIQSGLISDSIRNAHCVVDLDEQKKIVTTTNMGGPFGGTSLKPCP